MSRSDTATLRDLQTQLDTLSSGTPNAGDLGATAREAAAAVGDRVSEMREQVQAQASGAGAAVNEAAMAAAARFGAAAGASRRATSQACAAYRALRRRTGLSDGAIAGLAAGLAATIAAAVVVPARRRQTSTLTLPGGREISLGPTATRAATRFGRLSRRARRKAEKQIQQTAQSSAQLAEKSRRRLGKAQRKARRQLGQFSAADQLAALREAAGPILNSGAVAGNVKAGTEWLKETAQKLQAMSERLDTRPVRAQAAKAAGSTRVAAGDVAGIPIALRDALIEAGWTPPRPKSSWLRVLGL